MKTPQFNRLNDKGTAYIIILDRDYWSDNRDEIKEWMQDNKMKKKAVLCHRNWPTHTSVTYVFLNDADAVAFKLRWV